MQKNLKSKVPISMRILMSKLFGENSNEAKKEIRSPAEWKKTLTKVLDEMYQYLNINIHSDELHTHMLLSGLVAAHESLKEDDFWLGYLEGILRLSLILLGDYPDHRRRRGGRKNKNHYRLNNMRSIVYTQNTNQKLQTMLAAAVFGLPGFKQDIREALRLFHDEKGYSASYKDFICWFKDRYPRDYASLF